MTTANLLQPARVWLRRGALDRSLAEGADPSVTPELARRARQLTSPRCRAALAQGIRDLVDAAAEPERSFSARVPVQRQAILRESALLLDIARDLDSADDLNVHGVALVERLLVSGDSPLYVRCESGTLPVALRQARSALHLA